MAIPKNDNQEMTNFRKFMEENGILNVYKLNLYQVLNFMFRVHNETIPKSFQTKFQYTEHKYETRQSKDNFIIPKKKHTNYPFCYIITRPSYLEFTHQ